METASLFEAAKPNSAQREEVQHDTPRVLSVGVFPRATVKDLPVESQPKQSFFAKIMSVFARRPRPAETAPVQTEWSLDRVTVVRNDLSDTDFEVIVAPEQKAKGKNLVGRAWKKKEVAVANPEPVETLK